MIVILIHYNILLLCVQDFNSTYFPYGEYVYYWYSPALKHVFTTTPNPIVGDLAFLTIGNYNETITEVGNNGTNDYICFGGTPYSSMTSPQRNSNRDICEGVPLTIYFSNKVGASCTKSKTTPLTVYFPTTYLEIPKIFYSLEGGPRITHAITDSAISAFVINIYTPVATTVTTVHYLSIGY